jgi:hypothetical protein
MNRRTVAGLMLILCCLIYIGATAAEQEQTAAGLHREVVTIKPRFLPPSEILEFPGVSPINGSGIASRNTVPVFTQDDNPGTHRKLPDPYASDCGCRNGGVIWIP